MSNISFESLFDRKASLRSNTAEEDLAKLGKMLMNKKKKSMGLVPRKRYQAPKRKHVLIISDEFVNNERI